MTLRKSQDRTLRAWSGWIGRRFGAFGLALALAALTASGLQAQGDSQLTVYTAIPKSELALYQRAFAREHPDISIVWVRDSTDIIANRLRSEGAATKADLVWGLAATQLAELAESGSFAAYAPKGFDALDRRLSDAATPPRWVGQRAWVGALCVNSQRLAELDAPVPRSWSDLLKPIYKGQIMMPHPDTSGTGYLHLIGWMHLWGEAGAWGYMNALHKNVAAYTQSGSKPCTLATEGRFPIGLSYASRVADMAREGAPLELVLPQEGVGWDIEGFALLAHAGVNPAAKVFADWSVGKEAMALYGRRYPITAMPRPEAEAEKLPADTRQRMVYSDFGWSAANHDRIVEAWRRRYDEKAEPQAK